MNIGGVCFRFIDTAGLRDHTTDAIETLGISKTKERMQQASLIIYLFDLANESLASIHQATKQLQDLGVPFIKVGNKLDAAQPALLQALQQEDFVLISAVQKQNLDHLQARIMALMQLDQLEPTDTIVVNARHYESLTKSQAALIDVLKGIEQNLSNELLVLDIRKALHHLGEITGEITTEDLLDDLFSKFCLGK